MNPYDALQSRLRSDPRTWLVTGAAGFIGSNLVEKLLQMDQRVVGLDNGVAAAPRNLEAVRELAGPERWKNFRHVEGDIREPAACRIAAQGADVILHQAALGSVPTSIKDPVEAHAANVTGFLNILMAAREARVPRVVYASSCAVYGDDPGLPKIESSLGRCLSPYAVTKRANEIYAEVFAGCYGLETIGLRYFNVFGPRQDPNGPYAAVIPRWIESMREGRPIFINGDGQTSRDFCYVADIVQANFLAATVTGAEAIGQVYNIAAGARTSLNELFGMLRGLLLPHHPGLEFCLPSHREFLPGEIRHSEADIAKATRLLEFEPRYTVEAGLVELLDWYRRPAPKLTPAQGAVAGS